MAIAVVAETPLELQKSMGKPSVLTSNHFLDEFMDSVTVYNE